MLFSSLEFLYLFLPVALAVYFVCPARYRNGVILLFSLAFYGFGEPVYLFLMIAVVVIDHLFGRLIASRETGRRGILICAVAVNIGILFFFKYYAPFSEALGFPHLEISLPLGISFYIFQALSYVIDVYRREVSPQKSLVGFGAYVTLFPQLVAGPIVRYSDVQAELEKREVEIWGVASGIATFSAGLLKKVLLANGAGECAEAMLSKGESTASMWLGLIAFSFQIYYDFSGYSDMAIGLGRMLGFSFPQNFNYPYISQSITEFWRRWHITLSSWFREYVYIPLGGNRRGRLRQILNLLA